jgi:hypothetical protein
VSVSLLLERESWKRLRAEAAESSELASRGEPPES